MRHRSRWALPPVLVLWGLARRPCLALLSPVRYFGSKASVTDQIIDLIRSLGSFSSACDPFGGLGTVGVALRRHGYRVVTGDQLMFAHFFQIARLELAGHPPFKALVQRLDGQAVAAHLDSLPGKRGWLTRSYAVERSFFTVKNAERIDAIWKTILGWRRKGMTGRREHALLMASLIDSADAVANTAGTYHAYLKQFAPRTRKAMRFRLLEPVAGPPGDALLSEARRTARAAEADVLYLDPPYNRRNYGGYYHLPETLARGRTLSVRGVAGLPNRSFPPSAFYVRAKAESALRRLVQEAPWRALVLHYSDKGLVPAEAIRRILHPLGEVEERIVMAQGFSTVGSRSTPHRIYAVVR